MEVTWDPESRWEYSGNPLSLLQDISFSGIKKVYSMFYNSNNDNNYLIFRTWAMLRTPMPTSGGDP